MSVVETGRVSDVERLRLRHLDEARGAVAEHLERIAWSAERIRAERRSRLRDLVRVAQERSPWHRDRLAHLDPATLEEDDLAGVPPMTKADLMANFDDIVTDPRLRRDVVEAHLAAGQGEAYLVARYHAVASSGSSGQRGVFVHDWDAWTTYYLACFRYLLRQRRRAAAAVPAHMAVVAAGKPTHMSAATFRTFSDPTQLVLHPFPVTRPLPEIIAGLAEVQPEILSGYPSALHQLALEARAGGLRVAPEQVVVFGEPLLPEHRSAMEEVWGVSVHNWWGTSEANVLAASCGEGPGMHLHEDLYVVEPVHADGRPAGAGERSSGVLLTSLRNDALPLIRYEIDDEVTVLEGPCPCGAAHRRIDDVQGRADEVFRYGAAFVHPHVFRTRLAAEPGVVEYQVVQTAVGAEVLALCGGPVDLPALGGLLAGDLVRCGVAGAVVTARPVDALDRGGTGKLRRFVPLR